LSTSLSNVAKLAAHPNVWVFNANCDGTIIYNDPVFQIKFFRIRTLTGLTILTISYLTKLTTFLCRPYLMMISLLSKRASALVW
jgi:hypothetical protein